MKVPSSLLRTKVTIHSATATGTGVTMSAPVTANCHWDYVKSKSRSVATDSVRAWFGPEVAVNVGDQVTFESNVVTIDRIILHLDPHGLVAAREVYAS